MDIRCQCPKCSHVTVVTVSATAYHRWQHEGVLIQRAFPELDSYQREALITGICTSCWTRIFAEP